MLNSERSRTKYKVIKSDLFLKGRIIPENSEIELSEEDTKGIEDHLEKLGNDSEKESKNKRGNK